MLALATSMLQGGILGVSHSRVVYTMTTREPRWASMGSAVYRDEGLLS
jgi:hypothetical protein